MNISDVRLDKVSDICISVGQVIFAAVFIEPLLRGETSELRILMGLVLAIICWMLSLVVIKEINE